MSNKPKGYPLTYFIELYTFPECLIKTFEFYALFLKQFRPKSFPFMILLKVSVNAVINVSIFFGGGARNKTVVCYEMEVFDPQA